ncbi:MAG: hypothetical protein FD166_2976 [Bacteroidetes bacterium]|nr:MAG: hypothetical protein FD166_2976 [Bacteroidota bacterium]
MSDQELLEQKRQLIDIAELGARKAISRLGLIKDEISQREAYRQFGEGRVKVWVQRKLCNRVKIGERNSKTTYSLIELELLDKLEKMHRLKQ